jgi:hypothetical protein
MWVNESYPGANFYGNGLLTPSLNCKIILVTSPWPFHSFWQSTAYFAGKRTPLLHLILGQQPIPSRRLTSEVREHLKQSWGVVPEMQKSDTNFKQKELSHKTWPQTCSNINEQKLWNRITSRCREEKHASIAPTGETYYIRTRPWSNLSSSLIKSALLSSHDAVSWGCERKVISWRQNEQ